MSFVERLRRLLTGDMVDIVRQHVSVPPPPPLPNAREVTESLPDRLHLPLPPEHDLAYHDMQGKRAILQARSQLLQRRLRLVDAMRATVMHDWPQAGGSQGGSGT